mmetsp:Transcript_123229/g.245361  ORF Transcript_123229/g.245361 Transcript_123229/m.245361 type:complete len:86 (+) Transcript_123229:1634-1891(+)
MTLANTGSLHDAFSDKEQLHEGMRDAPGVVAFGGKLACSDAEQLHEGMKDAPGVVSFGGQLASQCALAGGVIGLRQSNSQIALIW